MGGGLSLWFSSGTISQLCLYVYGLYLLGVCLQGLSLVLSEGGLRDGEEKDHPMEEDSGDSELLQGYQWLLRDLPRLPLFDSVRVTTSLALQQVSTSRSSQSMCTCGEEWTAQRV